MKEKIIKIGFSRLILISVSLLLVIFSGFTLLKINKLNLSIYNQCEPRTYTEWTKEVEIPLTPKRTEELKNEIVEVGLNALNNIFLNSIIANKIQIISEYLKEGYEVKMIPDEERRAKSRMEVEAYNDCLKNQEASIKQRPEVYKFLVIGDILIIAVGLLIAFAMKKE